MESLVAKAAIVNETIARRLQALESRINELHVGWQGESAEQHKSNARVWHESMQQMRTELSDLGAIVDAARATYGDAVEHNKRIWPT